MTRHAVALATAADTDLEAVDGESLGSAIVALDALIGHLEAARLSVRRAHSRTQAWQRDGARPPAQWHRDHRRVTAGQAARDVATAHALADLPRTAAAVTDGTVTAAPRSDRRPRHRRTHPRADRRSRRDDPRRRAQRVRPAGPRRGHRLHPPGVLRRGRRAGTPSPRTTAARDRAVRGWRLVNRRAPRRHRRRRRRRSHLVAVGAPRRRPAHPRAASRRRPGRPRRPRIPHSRPTHRGRRSTRRDCHRRPGRPLEQRAGSPAGARRARGRGTSSR